MVLDEVYINILVFQKTKEAFIIYLQDYYNNFDNNEKNIRNNIII